MHDHPEGCITTCNFYSVLDNGVTLPSGPNIDALGLVNFTCKKIAISTNESNTIYVQELKATFLNKSNSDTATSDSRSILDYFFPGQLQEIGIEASE